MMRRRKEKFEFAWFGGDGGGSGGDFKVPSERGVHLFMGAA